MRRQITFINNRPVEKLTKSKAGLREVPLLPELEQILRNDMPANDALAQYVVDGEEALSERSFRNTWKRICKKVSLPKGVTPHVLRHTFLTHLQATGRVDIKTLQSIAGHSKITMTMSASRSERLKKHMTCWLQMEFYGCQRQIMKAHLPA